MKKGLVAILVGLSLLTSVGTYVAKANADVSFIDVDLSTSNNSDDTTFGIECGDPDFVYMTVYEQGLVVPINKNVIDPVTGKNKVEAFIDDPDSSLFETGLTDPVSGLPVILGQHFYGIVRDPSTGNLFINEGDNGKVWRLDPNAKEWTRIPILPEIVHPDVTYASEYSKQPNLFYVTETFEGIGTFPVLYQFFIPEQGELLFADGYVWTTLNFDLFFDDVAHSMGLSDLSFRGVVRINPVTLQVDRISIPDAVTLAGLNVDRVSPTQLWIADKFGDKVYGFNTQTLSVTGDPISLPAGSTPNHIDTNEAGIFVALNKFGDPTSFSEIARIDRFDLTTVSIINTTAPNFSTGTFTVFVADVEDEIEGTGDELIWTDQNGHVGHVTLALDGVTPIAATFFDTETFGNHFGCIPFDGQFWFAGHGSVKVGILPNSKFSVGGLKRPSGKGGSDPVARSTVSPFADSDTQGPVFGQVITSPGSLKISAQITDDVGVKDANVIIAKKPYAMQPHDGNPLWWGVTIPSENLPSGQVFFKIVARDFGLNTAQYEGSAESTGGTGGGSQQGPLFVTVPLAEGIHNSAYSIVASGITQDTKTMSLQVTIKNTSSEPLQNIRIVLSPELKGKFLLSDYAIKNIDPNSEYTISLKLNGKPNVDVRGEPIPYNGRIIISVDNKSPYILELSGAIPNESAALQSLFMKNIASKGEQRYKSFVKPEERISQAEYDVKLGSGESVIKSASDELIITNTSDKPLKNLRIMTSAAGNHFIPEQKNIDFLPAGSFVKVKLVSKLNDAQSRELQGEIVIAPENGIPVTVPIQIGKTVAQDSNKMYEVITTENGYISNTADSIVIRNNSEESIDNVRVILPTQLAKIFSLSSDAFKSIDPSSEVTINIEPRGGNVKQILNDYRGEMIIVSSDGMKKVIPINIVWKGISSEHFIINARDNAEELAKAAQVINFLERSYAQVGKIIGNTNSDTAKTVIYMTSSLEEVRMLSEALAPSTYVYDQDVALVWSNSEDVNALALKEFVGRTIMQDYGTYYTKQKVALDKGNWLVDGISNYVTASIVGEHGIIKEQLDAFNAEPTSFEWYGAAAATPAQHGASYALFKFLAQKYGDTIIDKILNNLGSTMVSNNRCDTVEQCVLLRAVYDANGMDINDKRHDMSFDSIVEEWQKHVDEYPVKMN